MIISALAACSISFLVCGLLLRQQKFILAFIRRTDLRARQASHATPTLRLGGIGIFAGLLSAALYAPDGGRFLLPLLVAALPIFVSGLLEDIGRHQSPARRLWATVFSGVLAIWLLDLLVTRVGIPAINPVFTIMPVAIAFTLFATAGIVHAFNLIDGLNGFASFNALISLVTLLLLAESTGISEVWLPGTALAGALLGFLVLNYPKGRIFLGDTGAYLIGFCLVWMGICLVDRQATLTPWAILLVFFWPVADTFLAIIRRLRSGTTAARADRLHAHHVMMRGIEIAIFGRKDRIRSNPLASVLLIPLILPPPLTALVFWDQRLPAAIAAGIYAALFALSYGFAIEAIPRRRRRSQPAQATVTATVTAPSPPAQQPVLEDV